MELKEEKISEKIKTLAKEVGFTDCGIAPACKLEDDAIKLRRWLNSGMHAGMKYMENHFEKRIHPATLVPGAKSVIVVLLNYYPKGQISGSQKYIISKYAYGRDYHSVIKSMLKRLQHRFEEELTSLSGRMFVDSAPVLERALASLAGLGWIGKNANLISPKHGSYCFMGEIITDVELACNKQSVPDFCGSCTKCIEACPTRAIVADRIIDSRKCISYWTIEHVGSIDPSLKGRFENRIFGCDICQDVCPWNRKSQPGRIKAFYPSPDLLAMTDSDWQEITEERFNDLFKGTALMRAGFKGLKRNIDFV